MVEKRVSMLKMNSKNVKHDVSFKKMKMEQFIA